MDFDKYTYPCSHHLDKSFECFWHPYIPSCPLPVSPHSRSDQDLISFPVFFFFFFFCFLGPCPRHTEVPKLAVESELQMPAYTTATAMPDPSCICNLCRSLWQGPTLNPLSKPRGQIHIVMDISWVHNPLSHNGNSAKSDFYHP